MRRGVSACVALAVSALMAADGAELVRNGTFDEKGGWTPDGKVFRRFLLQGEKEFDRQIDGFHADNAKFLLTVTVSGKLPEGAEWGETHTKYAFRTVSGGTHTVELCDFDGIHDAVRMDGYCMFYLIKDGMTELP